MDLEQYFKHNAYCMSDWCRKYSIKRYVVQCIKLNQRSASLLNALKITLCSKGEVYPEDLLSPKEKLEFAEFKKNLKD